MSLTGIVSPGSLKLGSSWVPSSSQNDVVTQKSVMVFSNNSQVAYVISLDFAVQSDFFAFLGSFYSKLTISSGAEFSGPRNSPF